MNPLPAEDFDKFVRRVFHKVSSRCLGNPGDFYYFGLKRQEIPKMSKQTQNELNNFPLKNGHQNTINQPFRCQPCNAIFLGQEEFKKHFESVHQIKSDQFKCGECYSNFSSQQLFMEHFRTVHEAKMPAKQNRKLKNYPNQELTLLENKAVHEGKNPKKTYGRTRIKCCYCNTKQIMYNADSLAKHCLEVHEGKKIYHCSLCNSTCSEENEMHMHLLVHEEVQSFKSTIFPQNHLETYFPDDSVQKNYIPSPKTNQNDNFMAYQTVRSEENDQNISTEIQIEIDGSVGQDWTNTENIEIFQLQN